MAAPFTHPSRPQLSFTPTRLVGCGLDVKHPPNPRKDSPTGGLVPEQYSEVIGMGG